MCLYIYMYVCVCTRCVVYVYIILLCVCVSVSKYVKIHIHAGLGFDQVAKRAVVDDFWSFSLDSSDSKSPQAIPEHKWNEAPNSPFDSVMMRHDASWCVMQPKTQFARGRIMRRQRDPSDGLEGLCSMKSPEYGRYRSMPHHATQAWQTSNAQSEPRLHT